MAECLISLGTNLGERQGSLDQAVRRIAEHPRIEVVAKSSYHRTEPAGGPSGQHEYLNAAARLETALAPEQLMSFLLEVEQSLGRQRSTTWGPRRIDLDLLLYDDRVQQTEQLVLPHPRMAFRRFVLAPAAEIAPGMIHPTTGWTIAQLLEHLDTAPPYVAILSARPRLAARLARRVSAEPGIELIADPLDKNALAAAFDDPTGLGLDLQLEFLELRAQRLRVVAGSQRENEARCFVSDFWLDELAALAQQTLSGADKGVWENRWRQLRSETPDPKLLVALAPEDFPRKLAQQVHQCDHTVVFALPAEDFSWAVAEVSAAIQAMQ